MRDEIGFLVAQVGVSLQKKSWQIAVAESCTGGLLGTALTAVAGSSAYFYGGVISYSNQAKVDLLGVNPVTLSKWGAVSEAIAREMAFGIRKRCGVQLGVAITGIAGPEGGSGQKPVGLVWIALDSEEGTLVTKEQFTGDRTQIREASVLTALSLIQNFIGGRA